MDILRIAHPFDRQDTYSAGVALVAGRSSDRLDASRTSPDLYPADLLTRQYSSSETDRVCANSWWLAHTRPRQEKAVAAALYLREVAYYLPLVTRKSLSRGRTRMARIAVFPGYVFVQGGDEERLKVLKTNRVLTVRAVPNECSYKGTCGGSRN